MLDQLLGFGELAADLRKVAAVGGEVVFRVKSVSVSSLCVLSVKLCFLGSEPILGVLDRLGPAREGRVSVGLSLQWTDDIAGLALPA